MLADKVAAKEAELHATYDERLRNYEERCVSIPSPVVRYCLMMCGWTGRRTCSDKSQLRDLNFEN